METLKDLISPIVTKNTFCTAGLPPLLASKYMTASCRQDLE